MKLRAFTLCLDPATGCFDDSVLVEFFADRDATEVSEHFFVHEGVPTLLLLVRYREPTDAPHRVERTGGRRKVEVPVTDRALFQALRRWRNDRSKRDGRPAFVLFTNEQIAAIARMRPATVGALQTIDGIGEARSRDYADEVLALVRSVPAGAGEAPRSGGSTSDKAADDDDKP